VRAIDVRSLLADATTELAAAGVDTPRVDAELLLAWVLKLARGRLLLLDGVAPADAERFRAAVARRATREPLQYITGRAPFRHVLLDVGPGVFIPRPETELLIDAALPDLRRARPVVVDLCSGSGALALAAADEAPAAQVYAVEKSPAALEYLRRNAAGTPVVVVEGDIDDITTLDALNASVDVVLSNPPYVPEATEVGPEVRHDPPEAVFGGEDGLESVVNVILAGGRLLREGGLLVMEHDESNGGRLTSMMTMIGWLDVADHDDLTGRPRYLTARRPDHEPVLGLLPPV
jgi:release factor glutamine methyltransferase